MTKHQPSPLFSPPSSAGAVRALSFLSTTCKPPRSDKTWRLVGCHQPVRAAACTHPPQLCPSAPRRCARCATCCCPTWQMRLLPGSLVSAAGSISSPAPQQWSSAVAAEPDPATSRHAPHSRGARALRRAGRRRLAHGFRRRLLFSLRCRALPRVPRAGALAHRSDEGALGRRRTLQRAAARAACATPQAGLALLQRARTSLALHPRHAAHRLALGKQSARRVSPDQRRCLPRTGRQHASLAQCRSLCLWARCTPRL
jgi:hypothetical protein